MADIFILNEPKDDELAEQLIGALSAGGWSISRKRHVSLDAKPPDVSLEEFYELRRRADETARFEASTQMGGAGCVLVLWSRHSFASDHIKSLVRETRGRDSTRDIKHLIQVVLDSIDEPPREFRDLDWISLVGWNGEPESRSFVKVRDAIARTVSRKANSVPLRGSTDSRAVDESAIAVAKHDPLAVVGGQDEETADRAASIEEPQTSSRQTTPSNPSSKAFICYRRQDTQGHTGRLHDRLVTTYGKDAVFIDVDGVPYGVDFVDYIEEVLKSCAVMVVMIGQSWTTLADKKGRRKLDLPDDLVRAEIAAALKQKIPVIPVLVEDASMPDAEDVPDEIRGLTRRNAIELTHRRWDDDVQRVLKVVEKFMGAAKSGR